MSIWNPFKTKTPEEELQEMLDQLSPHQPQLQPMPGYPPGMLQPQQLPPGLGGIHVGQGQVISPGMLGGMSQSQLQQILSTFMIGLTEDEKKEHAQLQAEWENERKNAKLNEFKKLPTELRQFVINAFTWSDHVKKINETTVPKSARLEELTTKDNTGRLHTQGSWTTHTTAGFMNIFANLPLPDGVKLEELANAHSEQCIEEEILNGEEKE